MCDKDRVGKDRGRRGKRRIGKEKKRKEILDIADRATATLDKVKIRNSKLQETMLWFAHETGELQTYLVRDTKVQYIKAEDLSNLIMRLTDKIVNIK